MLYNPSQSNSLDMYPCYCIRDRTGTVQFLVLFRPGTTSVRFGLGTFFVPETEHVNQFPLFLAKPSRWSYLVHPRTSPPAVNLSVCDSKN